MVAQVTLVAEYLLIWCILPSAHAARAVLALPARVVLAVITVWFLHSSHTLPIASSTPNRLQPRLNVKDLLNEMNMDFLRSLTALTERRKGQQCPEL